MAKDKTKEKTKEEIKEEKEMTAPIPDYIKKRRALEKKLKG